MRGSMCGRLQRWPGAALGAALVLIIGFAGSVEARPVRGPVLRAERRLARVQALLEREQTQVPARPRMADMRRDPATGDAAAAETPRSPAGVPTAAPPGATTTPGTQATAPAKPPVTTAPGVARAAYEAPVPTPADENGAAPASRGEPAADGTYSVLVQPQEAAAQEAAAKSSSDAGPQAGSPLRFPDASTP